MRDLVNVKGIVLRSSDYAEYDRRLTLLTDERGKITVFAHGARRSGNRFMATTEPFSFGEFILTEGRTAYNLQQTNITCFFEELRTDLAAYYLGSYMMEIADYYSRENNDDLELLKLLYRSLKAAVSGKFSNKLIKAVYQIKTIVVNGEFPGIPAGRKLKSGTVRALDHVVNSSIEKLYTFDLAEDVLNEFALLSDEYMAGIIPGRFKSLELYKKME